MLSNFITQDVFPFQLQTVRVVEAASALARKVHLYELLALLQKTVDKLVIYISP